MRITRRNFIETLPLGGIAAHAALAAKSDPKTGMPTRILGKTGARVSAIGFGCGSRFLMYKEEDKAAEALTRALDLGINYLDSAYSYGNGRSETRVGQIIKGRRQGLWIATKMSERDGAKAMRIIEDSLKRLQLDRVDLIHVHSLGDAEDLAKVEGKGGLLETLYKCRDQKLTRFIGVTSHTDPVVLKTALERHDFDCTQMSLNAALVGMANGQGGMVINRDMKPSFEHVALPVALKKKMGVTAMKIFAQDGLVHAAPIEKLLHYSMSLPVACSVLGMPKLAYLEENVKLAKAFRPLGKPELKRMSEELSKQHKARLDRYFSNHVDA
jgi:predicted aldo/keto reductase-like oxidoreductase